MSEERDLTLLRGSKKVRDRPSVILGSDGIRGVEQTLFEIITNSIDRWKDGYGDKVYIKRFKDNSFTIQDWADGLPIAWVENEQAYNWDISLNKLYGGDNYKQSDTLHGKLGNFGLGLASSQQSSEYMNVVVRKPNIKYSLKFKDGRPLNIETLDFLGKDDDTIFSKEIGRFAFKEENNYDGFTGTTINYKPDGRVFTELEIPIEWILNKLRRQAMVNSGIELIFEDEISSKSYSFKYNTISDYLKELTNEHDNMTDIIEFNGEAEGQDKKDKPKYKMNYTFSFTFNNKIQLQEYYHNSSELTELNLNVTTDAVKKGLTTALHKYILNNKLYKKGEKIKFDDIKDSLVCILSSKSTRTSYSNQTKLSIDNKFIKDFISKDLEEQYFIYLTENSIEAKKISNQILINKRANDKALKTKSDLKQKLQGEKKGLKLKVEGLRDCDMSNSELEERIFIVDEGLSANSTIADSFDNRIMGCLGLRGRFINSLKKGCSISDVLNNQPALGIIQAMGAGIEIPKSELKKYNGIDSFNINNLRYGSIAILCDSDAFGYGISLSILTFLYKYMPTLVKQGRVYFVMSPRFEIIDKKDNVYYVYNEQEKQLKIKELGENNIKSIGIKKGLGEFNKDEFWDYVLSPSAREKSFIKILYDEKLNEQINYYFNMLMGDDIDNRKQFIKDKIVNVDVNELD
ncbi:DNA topoisomerase [Clostridium sp. VAP52]|uniref:DNA topoisomerase n=1 Tax=Clostridium sp. VAP52 TaxID=2949977 RepID=UPI00207AA230|nr:DNA topoisomerase [Clostridium sp. VAP52]